MLNVAVSRARDSFLVFGDMGTFVPGTSAPSSVLAKYLFQSESFNWLSAIRQPNSRWYRFETSLVYRGSEVIAMINKLKEDLEKRKVNPLPVG